ncbi:hypothetical protein P389DRAFT_210914 [Cystobasidium minutum MCA 4210]|uniref:uncharacterized protein n=1 Tax=Cystobasidium minutum MCA 4210 TaxID=1397322 RepID=UPI0034CE92D9|eukprot:jgi/Rhomi1/210914/estExt_Genemark1.C_4_t20007
MSIDRRQPGTWDNDAPGGPAVLREIITKDLGDLSTQDREAIKHAGGAFIRYTAFGTVLGAGLGAMAAMRGRYSFANWKKLPRVFPNGLQAGPNPEVLRERIGFFMRTIAFSMGGVIIGQSAGFMLGTWRSSQIIKQEGNYENIEKVMKRVQQDIKDNYGKMNEGREDAYANQGRSIPPSHRRKLQGVEQDTPRGSSMDTMRLERPFEPDSSATNGDQAWSSGSFAKDMGPGNDGFYGSPQSSHPTASTSAPAPTRRSRWEELRGSKDSRDSAWERIRQDNAREQLQSSSYRSSSAGSSTADGLMDDRPASELFNEERRRQEDELRRASSKEKERREYEKMFERESKGIDSL